MSGVHGKRSLVEFLEVSSSNNDNLHPPVLKKHRSDTISNSLQPKTNNYLHILKIGSFHISKSISDIRKLAQFHPKIHPCDIHLSVNSKNHRLYAFLAFANDLIVIHNLTIHEIQQTLQKRKNIHECELISNPSLIINRLYDRSLLANTTNWIRFSGIANHSQTTLEIKKWLQKVLLWNVFQSDSKTDMIIDDIRIFHNARYSAMNGFALIQMKDKKSAELIVNKFQNEWKEFQAQHSLRYFASKRSLIPRNSSLNERNPTVNATIDELLQAQSFDGRTLNNSQSFYHQPQIIPHYDQKYERFASEGKNSYLNRFWIDFVSDDWMYDFSDLKLNDKQLLFFDLHWKVSKSLLEKYIKSLLEWMSNSIMEEIDIELLLKEMKIKVMATVTGYPLGRAMVTFVNVKEREFVMNVFVKFQSQSKLKINESLPSMYDQKVQIMDHLDVRLKSGCKQRKEIDIVLDVDIPDMDNKESEDENESEVDSDDNEEDSDLIDSDALDSDESGESESESSDEIISKTQEKYGLSKKAIEDLWRWKNPNKKMPKGLLTEKTFTGKLYRKNWKELKRKDWWKEWNKPEREMNRGNNRMWVRGGKLVLAEKHMRDKFSFKPKKNISRDVRGQRGQPSNRGRRRKAVKHMN